MNRLKYMNKYMNKCLLAFGLVLLIHIASAGNDQYAVNYNIPITGIPTITGFAPPSPVNDLAGAGRTFNITVDQIANITWYINGSQVQKNTTVTKASYTKTGLAGFWNVTAIVQNINGTASHMWLWNVLSSISVSSCGSLNKANSVYVLNSDVSGNTCFTFGANNIILDGQGKTASYSMNSSGYGIDDTGGYSIIIKNLSLVQKSNYAGSYGINFKNVVNSLLYNVSIVTTGNGIYLFASNSNTFTKFNISASSWGAYLESSNNNSYSGNILIHNLQNGQVGVYINGNYNNFSNANILAQGGHGVKLDSANYNVLTGGSIVSTTNYDYYLLNSANNNFMNTNFTKRQIYYYDNKSNFNYGNSGIWLNTKQNVAPTASLVITRTLINWNQTNVTWQELLSANRMLSYGMIGLLPNTNYSVWNGSIISKLRSDANGNLQIFNINQTTALRTIKVSS